MSISDLETAIRLGLRMCILIYNDSSYAAEVHYFRRPGIVTKRLDFPTEMMRTNTRLCADQARRHIGQ